jgi:hypothetical protein
MYKTVLVKQMIEDGAELLRQLDGRGVPVRAAAWFDDPEKLSWKLIVVTSVAENPGPLEAYLQIQKAMSGLQIGIALDDIIVMSPISKKFQEFRRTIEGAARGESLHPKPPSPGVAFDDAYVYRWLVK